MALRSFIILQSLRHPHEAFSRAISYEYLEPAFPTDLALYLLIASAMPIDVGIIQVVVQWQNPPGGIGTIHSSGTVLSVGVSPQTIM